MFYEQSKIVGSLGSHKGNTLFLRAHGHLFGCHHPSLALNPTIFMGLMQYPINHEKSLFYGYCFMHAQRLIL